MPTNIIGPIGQTDWIALVNARAALRFFKQDQEKDRTIAIEKYEGIYKDTLYPYVKTA